MKLNFTRPQWLFAILIIISGNTLNGQSCQLAATAVTNESICKATGSITLNTTNGSGNYNYIVTGPTYNSTTSSNIIAGLQAGVYTIKVKDITTGCVFQLDNVIVAGTYQDPRFVLSATDVTCGGASDGTITVNNVQFGKARFAFSIVAPSASGVGTTNSTGAFSNLIAGNYTIQLSDSCGGLQTRIITISNHTWSITGTAVTKVGCDSADAVLTVTDNNGNTNVSGNNFTGYMYGFIRGAGDTVWSSNRNFRFYKGTARSVSFAIKDPCGNVIVSAWFDNNIPTVNASVSSSNKVCNTFTATVKGQHNLTNPQYCIYNAANALITCNTSGVFNLLPYGSYCINITDNCYDTTITRCFRVTQPPPNISGINISNKGCNSFTATINSGNITNGQYCLYDGNGVVIVCNTTGVFNNIPYGTYCAHVQNDPICYDTTIISCFTVIQPVPDISTTVSITRNCSDFTAKITGQNNLTNPQYCLYDNSNMLLICNNTGQFTNLAYGSYCIKMQNDPTCYDTLITRCFSTSQIPVNITVNANPSCSIGTTDVRITLSNGVAPYTVKIFDPSGMLVSNTSTSGSSVNINGLSGLPSGSKYKVVVTGSCGSLDSTLFTPRISTLTKTINANSKCPGGAWQNGSGDLLINAVFSEGHVTPKIIYKGGTAVSINYTTRSGSNFTFTNLQAAVYIIQYTLENCSNFVYDTFNLKSYTFPSLDQSSVYQCNNNSFKVNATATGGITPYTYEIIGSTPTSPSIIQSPQATPAFNINNGTTYSVVRMRVIDACGNATINDASILPLGNTVITASSNCYYNNIILSVDSIPNATYTWYKKTSPADSVLIGSSQTYSIPNLLPSDTGTYISVASVNSGCLTKISSYQVTGACGSGVLPINDISFNGFLEKDNVQLKWTTTKAFEAIKFIVERSSDGRNFSEIGTVNISANNNIATGQYFFSDVNAVTGKNFYRLNIIKLNRQALYTNVVEINKSAKISISVMPNPVVNEFSISFQHAKTGNYNISLISSEGSVILTNSYTIKIGDIINIQRPATAVPGVYVLLIFNRVTSQKEVIKLFFK